MPQARSVVLPVTPTTPAAPASANAQAATHHLAVLTAQVQQQMDWLELSRGGHRRAVFDARTWEWRVP